MVLDAKQSGSLFLRLIVGLALLGCARMGSAAGTWSVIPLWPQPADVVAPTAVALDAAGNLYVADSDTSGRIQRRDLQGNWSTIATAGAATGQVFSPTALAVDTAGNLYVLDWLSLDATDDSVARVQERDAQGNWSVITTGYSADLGRLEFARALAVDGAGNLYVADYDGVNGLGRIQKRDTRGNWSVIASGGTGPGQLYVPWALGVDAGGNLYVAESAVARDRASRIQKLDAQGNWTLIAPFGSAPGQVVNPSGLAVDSQGDLYVVNSSYDDYGNVLDCQIEKRDAQGSWSVIATEGSAAGQVYYPWAPVSGLAVDAAGNLYVPDSGNDRIQERDAAGNWSVIAGHQATGPSGLAVDGAGNLYVARDEIEQRDAQGSWAVIAEQSAAALAADAAGNLYVADASSGGRIRQRDARGNWSTLATWGAAALAADATGNLYAAVGNATWKRDHGGNWSALAPQAASALAVDAAGNLYAVLGAGIWERDEQGNWSLLALQGAAALAADAAGNLYIADGSHGGRIQRRDAQGNWSVIAANGADPGQVANPSGLAMDAAGNLYVADTGNNRVQEYTPGGSP